MCPLLLLIQAATSVSHDVYSQQLAGQELAGTALFSPRPNPSPGLTSARRGCSWADSCPSGWHCAESQLSLHRAGTAAHPHTGWGNCRTKQGAERSVSRGARWGGPRLEAEEPREPALNSTSHTPRSERGPTSLPSPAAGPSACGSAVAVPVLSTSSSLDLAVKGLAGKRWH